MTLSVPRSVTFDIETKSAAQTPEGTYDLEISMISFIFSEDDRIIWFTDEDEIYDAVKYLVNMPRLVSFNGKGFDLKVIWKYMSRGEGQIVRNTPHYDLYQEFVRTNKNRNSLTNFAASTFGPQYLTKIDFPDSAPALWRMRPDLLRTYNLWDTHLTHLLYLHVITHGYVWCTLPTLRKFYPESISRIG